MSKIFEIRAHIKDYNWGSKDKNSWVGKIAQSINSEANTYAEAWFGDHVNGPSIHNNQSINKLNLYSDKLNFLAKVLSISKPLSIQVHPNQDLAEKLHNSNPNEFKDPYGKEEGAIALSKLELAYAFIDTELLKSRINNFPELAELIKQTKINSTTDAVRQLLSTEKKQISLKCKELWARIDKSKHDLLLKNIKKLETYFPEGDVGVFILILMNVVELQPGEAIFTNTGCPHAYLSGELLEIMKPSDNVLRCGLTEKKIDAENFLNALLPQHSSLKIHRPKDGIYELGSLYMRFIKSKQKIYPGNHPKIIFSLDAIGKLISKDCEKSVIPLSSFLIIGDKPAEIIIDSGQAVLFGSN